MDTCQTCYTELPSASYIAYTNPCCSTPICARCIEQNPRLKAHVPCLKCGDARAGSSDQRLKGVRRRGEERQYDPEGQFTIGDDDDEDDQDVLDDTKTGSELGAGAEDGSSEGVESDGAPSPGTDVKEPEPETELVEVKHAVARGDTLMSIARRYAADLMDKPHDLLKLNNLPPTALSTNPRILQIRRHLVISRRYITRRPGDSSDAMALLTAASTQEGEEDPVERAKRQAERSVKRFQLLTKTEDPAIGKVYLALAQEGLIGTSGSGSGAGGSGSKEGGKEAYEVAAALYEADRATEKVQGQKRENPTPATGTGAGGGEQDALDAFYSDEEWESSAGGPSRAMHTNASEGGQSGQGGKGKGLLSGLWGTSRDRGVRTEAKRWVVSPSTGSRPVEAYQKA